MARHVAKVSPAAAWIAGAPAASTAPTSMFNRRISPPREMGAIMPGPARRCLYHCAQRDVLPKRNTLEKCCWIVHKAVAIIRSASVIRHLANKEARAACHEQSAHRASETYWGT